MAEYKINSSLSNNPIIIRKLDTNEYEFSTTYNYLEYYGKSFLKSLSFITEFNNYLDSLKNSIRIEFTDNKFITIQFPIPFSDNSELVQLKTVEIDEFGKINIMIQKSSDELNKRIYDLENEVYNLKGEVTNLKEQIKNTKKTKPKFLIVYFSERYLFLIKGMRFLYPDDERCIISYIIDNKDDYINKLTEQIVNDLILKKDTITFDELFNNHPSNSFSTIKGLIELLAKFHFKVTNNSYKNSECRQMYLEYVKDENIKSVKMSEHYIPNTIINNVEKEDNIEIVNFPDFLNIPHMISVIYFY